MKKYLVLAAVAFMSTAVSAQNATFSKTVLPIRMADSSIQEIVLVTAPGDPEALRDFRKIIDGDGSTLLPIEFIAEGTLRPGKPVRLGEAPFLVTEDYAYRFLAKQLCEQCTVDKIPLKEKQGVLLIKQVRSETETVSFLAFWWVEKERRWYISFKSGIDPDMSMEPSMKYSVFY